MEEGVPLEKYDEETQTDELNMEEEVLTEKWDEETQTEEETPPEKWIYNFK